MVLQPEIERNGHQGIQEAAGNPDRNLRDHGHFFTALHFGIQHCAIGSALPFPEEQVTGQAESVEEQQQAGDPFRRAHRPVVRDHQGRADGGDGQSETDGEKPDIHAETD